MTKAGTWTIGRKITAGFGLVLVALTVVAVWSIYGIGGIVDDAEEVITGNQIDGTLAQKEVDHLNWANQVSSLLTDDAVAKLDVQTDDHKCGFGHWLYGPERKEAELAVPTIAPLLKEIEGCHAELHASAIKIGAHYHQAEPTLPATLSERETDHLVWASHVNAVFVQNLPKLEVVTDPTQCALGEWLASAELQVMVGHDPKLAELIDTIKEPHNQLHESAKSIQECYRPVHPGLIGCLRSRLDDHRRWAARLSASLLSNELPTVEVDPTKCKLGQWLESDECRQLRAGWDVFDAKIARVTGEHEALHETADLIIQKWRPIHPGLMTSLRNRIADHQNWAASLKDSVISGSDVEVATDPTICSFGCWLGGAECEALCNDWPEFSAIIEDVKTSHAKLHRTAVTINEAVSIDAKNKIYQESTLPALKVVSDQFSKAIDLEQANVDANREAIEIYKQQTLAALDATVKTFEEVIAEEQRLVDAQGDAKKIYEEETLAALQEVRAAMAECREYAVASLKGMNEANRVFAKETKPSLEQVQQLLGAVRDEVRRNVMTDEQMLDRASTTRLGVVIVSLVGGVAGIIVAILIAAAIKRALMRIAGNLSMGANLVAAASEQVSTSSQDLANGASEQASSLEETSSALEEMAAMTRTSADSARQANELSEETRGAAVRGDETTHRLTGAMESINESAGHIGKIIKVIEEIAFQTNLLALNAAVEAARAGEHGKGFAVVADEVRNLAQRAAEAARETTALIEGAVSRAGEGSGVADEVAGSLSGIVGKISKVSGLITDISKASAEQALGVEQVNIAVSRLDKLTQGNACHAEESASAAEELATQAVNLQSMVHELETMVLGKTAATESTLSTPTLERKTKPAETVTLADSCLNTSAPSAPAYVGSDDMSQF